MTEFYGKWFFRNLARPMHIYLCIKWFCLNWWWSGFAIFLLIVLLQFVCWRIIINTWALSQMLNGHLIVVVLLVRIISKNLQIIVNVTLRCKLYVYCFENNSLIDYNLVERNAVVDCKKSVIIHYELRIFMQWFSDICSMFVIVSYLLSY